MDGREVWGPGAKERKYIKRSRAAVIEAKQRVQLQKQTHSIFSSSLSHTNTSPALLFTAPPIQQPKTMLSNSNFTYSQSSNGSQPSDLGSSNSSTCVHDTAPAPQQTQGERQATPANTQDTIHLSEDRKTIPSAHSGTNNQNTPDVDINAVLRVLTATPKAKYKPGPAVAPSTQGTTTTSTCLIAVLPGNDPILLSTQEIFPAVDIVVMKSLYTNKFPAANLLKLEASVTYKKKSPAHCSSGTGEASFNLSTTCKGVNFNEYESISNLLRPIMVYGVPICTFPPAHQKLHLGFRIMTSLRTL